MVFLVLSFPCVRGADVQISNVLKLSIIPSLSRMSLGSQALHQ